MTVQELEELLSRNILKTLLAFPCGAAQPLAASAQTDHVTGVLLPQTSSVAELHLRTRVQAVPPQSEQLLQAVNEPLVMMPQLHAAVLPVAMATRPSQRLVQLPFGKVWTHLHLRHLMDGGGGQVLCDIIIFAGQ